MRKILQTIAISAVLLAPAAVANAQISVGIRIGLPPMERAYRVPARPGPDYIWVEGYQYPVAGKYQWHDGYWTRPPYQGAYWVAPYYVSGRYYVGQWQGSRGNVSHDHSWDKHDQRDERRDPPGNNGRGNGNGNGNNGNGNGNNGNGRGNGRG